MFIEAFKINMLVANDTYLGIRIIKIYICKILSSSGPGPGPRSGPGQVPGQVQKVQGLRTKDLDLG